MKTVLALALAAITAVTPAFAEPTASASTAPLSITAEAPGTAGQRYCVVIPGRTGSYLDRKVCRTRIEWAKDGIDPLTLRK